MEKQRIESIDVLRGFMMFWIIGAEKIIILLPQLTNNEIILGLELQFHHVGWNGLRFYDILFPSFLFLSGISYPFSVLSKRGKGVSDWRICLDALKRMCILFLLGAVYNGLLEFSFETMRWASALARIGLASFFATCIYLFEKNNKRRIIICIGILLIYWILMRCVPAPDYPGADLFSPEGSIACYIDRRFLPGMVLDETYDPEGLMSTFPAVSTALLGMLTGELIKSDKWKEKEQMKVYILLLIGICLIILSLIWNLFFPINKKLWSSSFVCCVGGIDIILFAICYFLIDILKIRKWGIPFSVIGKNSIFAYMLNRTNAIGTLTLYCFCGVLAKYEGISYDIRYAIFYVCVMWFVLYFLYKKRVYIKV